MKQILRSGLGWLLLGLLSASNAVSQTPERFIVTATEVDALGIQGLKLCFAVEPANPKGAWWWHQGPTGCDSRRSSVMPGLQARVTSRTDGATEMYLEVPLHSGESRPVRISFGNGNATVPSTGANVKTIRRSDLDMPERF
jgi:hypothetical protein